MTKKYEKFGMMTASKFKYADEVQKEAEYKDDMAFFGVGLIIGFLAGLVIMFGILELI